MPQPAIQYRYWDVPSDLVLISGLPSHVACEEDTVYLRAAS